MNNKQQDPQKRKQIDRSVNSVAEIFYNELHQLGGEIEEKIEELKRNKKQD